MNSGPQYSNNILFLRILENACRGDQNDLDAFDRLLESNPHLLFERNRNYDTSIAIAMHLPYLYNKNKATAGKIANKVLSSILLNLQNCNNLQAIATLLTHTSESGLMPLHQAIISGNLEIIAKLIAALKIYPSLFNINLRNRSRDGCMLLQSAITQQHPQAVNYLIKELKNHPEIYKEMFSNYTNDGIMTIHLAIASGNYNIFYTLINELENHPDLFKENLCNRTSSGFLPLLNAIKLINPEIIKLLIDILIKHPKILQENLSNCSSAKFMPLQSAIQLANPEIVTRLHHELKSYPEIYATNLTCSASGIMPLEQALIAGNLKIIDELIIALKIHPKILQKNLGDRVLQGAINLKNHIVVDHILDELERYPDNLKLNLRSLTSDRFMPLQNALKIGNHKIIKRLISVLKQYPEIMEENISNRTKHRFVSLQQAFTLGNSEIIDELLTELEMRPNILIENFRTKPGFILLQKCINLGKHNIIHRLLNILQSYPDVLKASLSYHATDGSRPLHDAFAVGDFETTYSLIAALKNYPDLLKLNLTSRNKLGHTTLDITLRRNDFSLLQLYLQALKNAYENMAPILKSLNYRLSKETTEEIKALLKDASKGKTGIIHTPINRGRIGVEQSENFDNFVSQEDQTLAISNNELPLPTRLENTVEKVITTPHGGINPKYLDDNYESIPNESFHPGYQDKKPNKIHFMFINQLPKLQDNEKRKVFQINTPYLKASFYTPNVNLNSLDKVTFVCAGRKQNALLPFPASCIAVCTVSEFEELEDTGIRDILVVREIHGQGGLFPTGKITSRRLAILLAANYWQLQTCMMIDDNISCVEFEGEQNNWSDFYHLLKNNLRDEPCLNVSKHYSNPVQPGQLGSKLFMLNMSKIREKFPTEKDLTVLLPYLKNMHYWGEDYYFEIMLYNAFKPIAQGYSTIDKRKATFTRANKHPNSFALSGDNRQCILARSFDVPVEIDVDAAKPDWVYNTIECLNQIISINQEKYELKKDLHQKQKAQIERMMITEPLPPRALGEKLRSRINEYSNLSLRSCQTRALHSIAHHCMNQTRMQVIMATGTGKTAVLGAVALLTHPLLKNNEHIVITTANIQLVSQLCNDFKNTFPEITDSIFCISSDPDHISVYQGLSQGLFSGRPKIFIFCIDSLFKLIEKYPNFSSQGRLWLCDEYHAYASQVKDLSLFSHKQAIVIGFTATPPPSSPLEEIFVYSIQEGIRDNILSPLIIDSLNMEYNLNNVKGLIKCLPTMLKKQFHPGLPGKLKSLSECKGIIYLPSIELCNTAKITLDAEGILCYAIHSNNDNYLEELEKFKQSEKCVLLVRDMCKLGFDHKELSFAFILQNPSETNAEQIVGRVIRRNNDKIGYVVAFTNVVNKIMFLMEGQQITLPIFKDYLENTTKVVTRNEEFNERALRFHIEPLARYDFDNIRIKKPDQLSDAEACKVLQFLLSDDSSQPESHEYFFDLLESENFFDYQEITFARNQNNVQQETQSLKGKEKIRRREP